MAPRPDRRIPWTTLVVLLVCGLVAAVLFHRLHENSTSPAAQGAPGLGLAAPAQAGAGG